MKKHSIYCNKLFWILGMLIAMIIAIAPEINQTFAQQKQVAQKDIAAPMPALPPLPLSPTEKAEKDGTALRLSVRDVTKMALQNNLEIAIEDTNETLYQEKLHQNYGQYDPSIKLDLGTGSQKSPNSSYIAKSTSGNFYTYNVSQWNFTFDQNIKTGGTVSATFNSKRTDSNTNISIFIPEFDASTSLRFTQPLRRNFRIDQTRQQIKIANLDIKINDTQFKQRVVDIISGIQKQYWDLVAAIRNYEIQRNFFRQAQILLRDNERKVEIGTLAAINITETRRALAQREGDLITAERNVYDMENQLLTMISNDRKSEMWSQIVVPMEKAEFHEYKVNLESAVNNAMKNRPELEKSDMQIQKHDLDALLYRENRKWQFDFSSSFGTNSVAGPQSIGFNPFSGSLGPQADPSMVGGIGKAYKQLFTAGFTNWQLGFTVKIPLRNRAADAMLAQINVQKRQEILNRKNSEQKIQAEIRTSARKLDTDRKLVASAGDQRAYANEQLIGEQKRFEGGVIENYKVLEAQSNLSQAEFTELQALVSYKKSIIDFQKAEFSLLEANDFQAATGASKKTPDLK
jgi:outer membrane protein